MYPVYLPSLVEKATGFGSALWDYKGAVRGCSVDDKECGSGVLDGMRSVQFVSTLMWVMSVASGSA